MGIRDRVHGGAGDSALKWAEFLYDCLIWVLIVLPLGSIAMAACTNLVTPPVAIRYDNAPCFCVWLLFTPDRAPPFAPRPSRYPCPPVAHRQPKGRGQKDRARVLARPDLVFRPRLAEGTSAKKPR